LTFNAFAFTLTRSRDVPVALRYFSRNIHNDTASPTPEATITTANFQDNF
jgi:hypothetical protein